MEEGILYKKHCQGNCFKIFYNSTFIPKFYTQTPHLMKLYYSFFLLFWTQPLLWGQSLHEEASLSYYWKNKLGDSRLYTDNGLGKSIWIKNLPANWVAAYAFEDFSLQTDGPFGGMLLAPRFMPKFSVASAISQWGEKDVSFRGQLNFKKVSTKLELNGFHVNHPIDRNHDGFTDLDQKERFFVSNSWDAHVPNYSSSNRIQFMGLRERGGQMIAFSDTATQAYETGLNFQQLALQSQHLIAVRKKDLLLVDLKLKDHMQRRSWGNRTYEGAEWMVDAQAHYEYHLENEFDIFRFGLQFRQQRFDERLDSTNLQREEWVGGGFLGYDSYWEKHLQFITHINIIYHNLEGLLMSPNLKVNYSPIKALTLHTFGGQGWRYANPLTEYSQFLYSNRSVVLPATALRAERAWYYGVGVSASQWVNLWEDVPFLSFFVAGNSRFTHRIYEQQVVADLDSDPYQVQFYNLAEGERAYKLSWELDAQLSWSQPSITFNMDYRYDFAQTTMNGVLRELPLYSRHNWLFNLNYVCRIPLWKTTIHCFNLNSDWYVQSPQRLPDVRAKSNEFGLQSERFVRWDLSLEFPIYDWIPGQSRWKNFLLKVGFDNLNNRIQSTVFVNAANPFSPEFDAALRWNTPIERRFYSSLSYVFQ